MCNGKIEKQNVIAGVPIGYKNNLCWERLGEWLLSVMIVNGFRDLEFASKKFQGPVID